MAESDEQKAVHRRRFFRAALSEMLKPLSKTVARVTRVAEQLGKMTDADVAQAAFGNRPPPAAAQPRRSALPVATVLRPPGALPGCRFTEVCTQCGDCVRACPVSAIKIEPGGRGGGYPFIVPAEQACVLCDGLRCMSSCPTGALLQFTMSQIRMGTAQWRESTCARSTGSTCTICVDECPIGETAIELRDGLIAVKADGCTGCGVCENKCPTTPKAIVVTPSLP